MTFSTSFDHDVFVCFADVDNRVMPGGQRGWVDRFLEVIGTMLQQKGLSNVTLHSALAGNVTPQERADALRRSACIVAVMSPAYVESEWFSPGKALADAFLAEAEKRPDSIFVAEKSRPPREKVAAYDRFRHDNFWRADAGDDAPTRTLGVPDLFPGADMEAYYRVAFDLATAISRYLRPAAPRASAPTLEVTPVFLAECGPQLEDQRRDVQRQLEEAGIEVRPRGRLPADTVALHVALAEQLAGCRAFVQLLPDPANRDRALIQLKAASDVPDLAILQWRDPKLELDTLVAADREMVMRDTVQAETITDFCAAVHAALKRPAPRVGGATRVVFVDAAAHEEALVAQAFYQYNDVQWDWHVPTTTQEYKDLIEFVDGVVVYWGDGPSDRPQGRYIFFARNFRALKKSLSRLLIYDGPPPSKPTFRGQNFPIASERDGKPSSLLRQFLEQVKSEADGGE